MDEPNTGPVLDTVVNSSSFERLLEATFLSELLQEMWFARDEPIDVMQSTVDAFGYDLVLQSGSLIRHVQIKARRRGGSTSQWNLASNLQNLPSACAVLIDWAVNDIGRVNLSYRYFGGVAGEPIPPLGDAVPRHTRANAQGKKGFRPGLRKVNVGRFERVQDVAELADRLFGSSVVEH